VTQRSPTSLLSWLPIVEKVPWPLCPYTLDYELDFNEVLDKGIDPKFIDLVMGDYSLRQGEKKFIRSDMSSAKHQGPQAYCWTGTRNSLIRCIFRTAEDHAMKFGMEPATALCVRNWINICAPFEAFAGHPIGVEWRVFVSPDAVEGVYFYWPEAAIAEHPPEGVENWRELLQEASTPNAGDIDHITKLSLRVVQAIAKEAPELQARVEGGEWSVDWAMDINGQWWLIDMAEGHRSWHPHREPKGFGSEELDESILECEQSPGDNPA
jgi:hypothetical protein